MKKLGVPELEILDLAIKVRGTFNETDLESSRLKQLGVGKVLDTLASLKDKKLIVLNDDGSFSITDLAKEILWNGDIPLWTRILRLLQIKSCSIKEISRILGEPEEGLGMEIKKLQKNQFVLMSPQRVNETILRIFEILPQGAEAVDRTETEGFEKTDLDKSNQGIEISSIIYDIQKEVQDSQMKSAQKEAVARKLAELRDKLATGSL